MNREVFSGAIAEGMINNDMKIGNNQPKKLIRPLAFGAYFWPTTILTFAGLVDSLYLAVSHYRVYTDIGYESFCAISRAINCDTVSQSSYAVMGHLPVPVLGVVGYLFLLMLLVFVRRTNAGGQRMWSLFFAITLIYSAYSVFLAVISYVYIRSYCIMCIISYAINFLLLFYAWLIRRRFDTDGYLKSIKRDFVFIGTQRRLAATMLVPFTISIAALWFYFPSYWEYRPAETPVNLQTGLTAEGFPWIGTENAELVITEFTDYMCFQCAKTHNFLRKLMNRYPGKIKLIHRHFPMDSQFNPIVKIPFHEGSGKLSLLAIHAESEGKFWPVNDELYVQARQTNVIDVKAISDRLGIERTISLNKLYAKSNLRKLNRDIAAGLKLGISGTPSFVIEGKAYDSQIPAHILARIIE
jgi:uncharacterized membrane protein/predicted DsbA family dithiol-disulfide isomerase